jgi:invasion protein IalB
MSRKTCMLSQEQIQLQARQRVLTIELQLEAGGVKGVLLLPFGLSLKKGVTYQLEEGQAGSVQHFRTCLPAGCLIEIDFDSRTVASLKSGKSLKIKGTGDNGQEVAFSISLTGFAGALARLEALAS